jgi:hypothetical protein
MAGVVNPPQQADAIFSCYRSASSPIWQSGESVTCSVLRVSFYKVLSKNRRRIFLLAIYSVNASTSGNNTRAIFI